MPVDDHAVDGDDVSGPDGDDRADRDVAHADDLPGLGEHDGLGHGGHEGHHPGAGLGARQRLQPLGDGEEEHDGAGLRVAPERHGAHHRDEHQDVDVQRQLPRRRERPQQHGLGPHDGGNHRQPLQRREQRREQRRREQDAAGDDERAGPPPGGAGAAAIGSNGGLETRLVQDLHWSGKWAREIDRLQSIVQEFKFA